jgi:hypothetical protein
VSRWLIDRETAFLSLLKRSVFGYAQSPYLPLFESAGLTYEDVRKLLAEEGLEATLGWLHRAGVYVTLEEFKGRVPIRRSGKEYTVSAPDFNNALSSKHLEVETGGTRGRAQRLSLDLDLLAHDAVVHRLFLEAFQAQDLPMAVWRTVPPNVSGIRKALLQAKIGRSVERWFSQTWFRGPGSWKYVLFTYYSVLAGVVAGCRIPAPEHVPLGDADRIVSWLAEQKQRNRRGSLDTIVSSAVRICRSAKEQGIDISGSFFRVGSEALTPSRARILEAAGVTTASHYAMTETGPIAMACAHADQPDECHVLLGKIAVTQQKKAVAGRSVDALFVTGLLPSVPKVMINVEVGDTAVFCQERCGCLLEQVGFTQRIHTIRSYEKLTSEGMLFLGTELAEVVEDVLPRRFGGDPSDYQFLEEEVQGLARVRLLVSPRLGPINGDEVVATVLEFLAQRSDGNRLMATIWSEGKVLKVERREPVVTRASKILPFHVNR